MSGLTPAEQTRLRRTAAVLGWQTAALVLASVVLVAAVVLAVVTTTQARAGEDRLRSAVRTADDVRDAPAGVWLAIDGPRGLEVSDGMPSPLPDVAALRAAAVTGTEQWSRVADDDGSFVVLTAPARHGVTQAVLDPRPAHEETERLVAALGVAGAAGVLLAGLGGAWLGRRAVRPTVEALALQRRFVADASHELRTPLTLLTTRVQLLRRRLQGEGVLARDSRVPEAVDGVLADARALTAILEDMLVAADTRAPETEPTDLDALVRGVVDAAAAAAEERGVALVHLGTAGTGPVAEVSPTSVRRAVTALVDNALDHAATTVEVTTRATGGSVTVEVGDDGPGLPAGGSLDVFERFASRRVRSDDGARHYGLGLALVAEVAAQHGGAVDAGPRADGRPGTTVTLTLPATAPRARR
ncbi:sensor histidine kinase KdpD [Cellulomonas sp. PSBB021]|uniref:sensor histidine kinase n=1 Tax=Cellulomonas sp. PSBB021 TaxID=2003551 RepID=UPI000B8D29B7|nr:sensor histidine kinase [Cellulomonas sp. PSBB021]ASR54533.1 hypothetical protein CBP52_04625 [Cellulomonas sp. PSBB021]